MTLEPHTLTHDDPDERTPLPDEPMAPPPPPRPTEQAEVLDGASSATPTYRTAADDVDDRADVDDTDDVDEVDEVDEVEAPVVAGSVPTTGDDGPARFVDDPDGLRERWQALQVDFVDDPAAAVSGAAELVGTVVERFVTALGEHRDELQSSWSDGDDDTERLRQALRRYRGLFERVLDA